MKFGVSYLKTERQYRAEIGIDKECRNYTQAKSALVISLDFELFWGVTDSKTIKNYGANVEGEWQAIPAMLALFARYGIRATWATVGMLMCRDYQQWSDIFPAIMPTYAQENSSAYSVTTLARNFPKLFFARQLVEKIVATEGQELGSHSYSHFY